jgi:hypothetical protein
LSVERPLTGRKCLMCDKPMLQGENKNDEHVFPDWLFKWNLADPPDGVEYRIHRLHGKYGGRPRKRHNTYCVHKDCNDLFNVELELPIQKVIPRLIKNPLDSLLLNASELMLVTKWFLKIAVFKTAISEIGGGSFDPRWLSAFDKVYESGRVVLMLSEIPEPNCNYRQPVCLNVCPLFVESTPFDFTYGAQSIFRLGKLGANLIVKCHEQDSILVSGGIFHQIYPQTKLFPLNHFAQAEFFQVFKNAYPGISGDTMRFLSVYFYNEFRTEDIEEYLPMSDRDIEVRLRDAFYFERAC